MLFFDECEALFRSRELSGGDRLLYALPALTRRGAAVLDTPPSVLRLLRKAYKRVMEGASTTLTTLRYALLPLNLIKVGAEPTPLVGGRVNIMALWAIR